VEFAEENHEETRDSNLASTEYKSEGFPLEPTYSIIG
jgi:hypothetical protein